MSIRLLINLIRTFPENSFRNIGIHINNQFNSEMKKMDRRKFVKSSGVGLAGLSLVSASNPVLSVIIKGPLSGINSVKPADHGKALVNPDMGWTFHYYSNQIDDYGSRLEPSDTLDDFPGLSTIYLRVPWSFLELEEGHFNWELLDTPAQRWIDKGIRTAFRITVFESWMVYATPEWVRDAGARGTMVNRGRRDIWQPDFCDPVFLEKLENFVSAMAGRYDGNPYVDFVDIGSFGIWGEGHSAGTSEYCTRDEGIKKHIDIYCKYFKKTLLCINDDYIGTTDLRATRFPISDYAFSRGVTLRDDSIMVQAPPDSWYSSGIAQLFWPEMPVILETEHYGSSKRRNAFIKELFIQSVEDYHASYISIHWWPHIFLEENREAIDIINRRLGYRIKVQEVRWPENVKLGEAFTVNTFFANSGVAPCYPGGYPCITLKDEKGGIVSVLVDQSFNVRNLRVGNPGEAPVETLDSTFIVAPAFKDPSRTYYRNARPGNYDIFISVGSMDGTPIIELPHENDDGHKRYKLGKINILGRETDTRGYQ
jgi:hypothetical protein